MIKKEGGYAAEESQETVRIHGTDHSREKEKQMKILFVSDYVCPYCLVAKEAMAQAAGELGIRPEITWHPFELTMEPKPRVDTWNDAERRAHYQVLVEPCRKLFLDMKLPPHVIPRPYTRLAFEGFCYAKEHGKEEAYNDLMYRAYFIDEQDIGDLEVLCRLAERAGLDPEEYRSALESGVWSETIREANRHAREELHVTHVPTILIDGEEVDVKEYTKEEFVEIFRRASGECGKECGCVQKPEKAETEERPAGGCGEDGCGTF